MTFLSAKDAKQMPVFQKQLEETVESCVRDDLTAPDFHAKLWVFLRTNPDAMAGFVLDDFPRIADKLFHRMQQNILASRGARVTQASSAGEQPEGPLIVWHPPTSCPPVTRVRCWRSNHE